LPGGAGAIVEISKLRDYCLDPHHRRGRHKARVFLSTLVSCKQMPISSGMRYCERRERLKRQQAYLMNTATATASISKFFAEIAVQ